VSEASGSVPPYRVIYSGLCRDETKRLLARASAKSRFAELVQAIRDIDCRLRWIPLDFGQPLQDFEWLGIKEHIGVLRPLVVKYGVDETRHIVYVVIPFKLLPNSGL
jgi:hypothetical protein